MHSEVQSAREYKKKKKRWGSDVCVVCGRGVSDIRTEDVKVHNGNGGQNERKECIKKSSRGPGFCVVCGVQ
jgi:hypothetical protein